MFKKNEEMLFKRFVEISKIGWTKGVNKFNNSVGLTFESLLDKNPDSMFFPDYYGIEIKCSQRFSGYPISLFSFAFDGPDFYEMNRVVTTYGKADIKYVGRYQLQTSLYVNKYSEYNNYNFKLRIDRKLEKLFFEVYDINYKLIESKAYIDFQTLKTRLELKFSKMAMVYASKKMVDGEKYFRYYKIVLYYLKSFDKFLYMLENNYINVSILGRVSRSGSEEGRQRNKNLMLYLPKCYVEYLFYKIFEYNADLVK